MVGRINKKKVVIKDMFFHKRSNSRTFEKRKMWCGVKVALYKEVGGYCELVGYK